MNVAPTDANSAPVVREHLFSLDPIGLVVSRCVACNALRFPARAVCPACQGTALEDIIVSSEGTVYTFTIVRASPPGYLGRVPYAFGIVELSEGLRVTATITADDLEQIAVGDRVELELIDVGEGGDAVRSFAYRVVR